MKPKHHPHRIPLVLLGLPLLLLSPAAHAHDQDKDKDRDKEEKAAEVAKTEEAAEEKVNAKRAKDAEEAAKEAEEAAERAREDAERAKKAAEKKEPAAEPEPMKEGENPPTREREKAPESAPQPPAEKRETPAKPGAAENPDTPAKGERRREAAPGAKERNGRRPTPTEPREGRERRERPATPATPAEPQPPAPPVDEKKPPVDMPVVPSEPLKPREGVKPQPNDTVPGKEPTTPPAPGEPVERETPEIPATEPERQAESQVMEVTREVQRDLDQRKTKIEGRKEAQALIDDILGAESRISRAEIAREERFRPRIERQRPGRERQPEVSPDQRRAATTYFQQRLRGREVEGPPPEFFRHSDRRGDRRDPRGEQRIVERVEYVRPRYLNEGRRYVHFDSRAAIPAILMAAQAMNQVRFQPAREIAPMFHERQDVTMPLPPENYRGENSWVVSYPVDENSMISSEDILFLQGSTQFSDPYSYEVVAVMADAMKALPEEERFVIEGHASAEGSYDSNMTLSQQRAEHIVREIVRRGVSPYRLLPVGYGESEARHPAEAAEARRSQDRRVVVFRMKPESTAKR